MGFLPATAAAPGRRRRCRPFHRVTTAPSAPLEPRRSPCALAAWRDARPRILSPAKANTPSQRENVDLRRFQLRAAPELVDVGAFEDALFRPVLGEDEHGAAEALGGGAVLRKKSLHDGEEPA